jgi:hypothetical protein
LRQKESYLVPPEGENNEDDDYDEDISEEIKELAKTAREKLEAKNKNGKVISDSLYY